MSDAQWLEDLQQRISGGEDLRYLLFWGHRASARITATCLSQWFEAGFTLEDNDYRTAEHWMMAEKARLFGDMALRQRIIDANSPGAAKAMGKAVQGFDEKVWSDHRFEIVIRGNLAKFSQNGGLRAFLMATGNKVLVEASPVDRIWGIGLARDDPRATDPRKWQGLNLFGFALMVVRDQLRDLKPSQSNGRSTDNT